MQALLSTIFKVCSGGFGWDMTQLFCTRALRMFAFGFLSLLLLKYLDVCGWRASKSGWLLTLAQLGDTLISFWIATHADRLGRRKMLILSAALMILAGLMFALTSNFWLLLIAATVGVLAPTAAEVGPFQSIEQAMLSQLAPAHERTTLIAWYNLAGSLAAAIGSFSAGLALSQTSQISSGVNAYTPLLLTYAGVGALLIACFARMSPASEAPRITARPDWFGLQHSRGIVLKLSALFMLDAFAGGFVLQSLVARWFEARFELNPFALGKLFFLANVLSGLSSLVAAQVANRFGLINTMVFTHLPSNVLLILVPLMPNFEWAAAVLLCRFSISQMDVPTRQAFTLAVVHPEERSAASGITTVARSLALSCSPALAGYLLLTPQTGAWLFWLAGGLKIVYDLWLYRAFVTHKEAPDS